MDSNGVATDLQFLILQRRDLSLQRIKNEDNTNASRNDSRNDELRVNSLLKSYIDTQFLLIEYSLENLRRQSSVRALNDDEFREFDNCSFMFDSVRRLMRGDSELASKNANHIGRVGSLIQAVMQNDTTAQNDIPPRETEIYARPKIDEARRNAMAAVSPAGWKQTSPKAAEPPPRDASMSDGLEFRKLRHPRREVHSKAELAVLAELHAKLAKRNAAAGVSTEACFQILNPYVV
jgi:hypothetical protein